MNVNIRHIMKSITNLTPNIGMLESIDHASVVVILGRCVIVV